MWVFVSFCKSVTFLFNSAVFHQAVCDTLHLARGEDGLASSLWNVKGQYTVI